ncbi:MAG: ribbon-helix-helix protein, CopG family [Nitrospirae bacterium]|nr:ribbon-helix-helix protein, CopG family [Nitrospirota bacterium]
MRTTTFSIRIDEETKERLEKLAKSTSRSKSYLIVDAIKEYIDINEWQIGEIRQAVEEADEPGAKFIDHEKIKAKGESKLAHSMASKGR